MASDAEAVCEFTRGAGQPVLDTPEPMNKDEVFFLAKMMLDEIMEFTATVAGPEESKAKLKEFIDKSKDIQQEKYEEGDKVTPVADQADALVDSYYYSLNSACNKGINLSSVFGIVHAANMAKRDPETGKFLKRADGKIIKPKGWQPPNINAEIERQLKDGAWNVVEKENRH
mmetsp:Transcript_998/g.1268  ORF Transcript_998/g.1268 Transcript_998/m.1268 type:complete len:172 (+) Transcript_998:40-555(+)